MQTREIPCAIISKIDIDLVKFVYRDDYKVELSDVKMVDDIFIEFSEGRSMYGIMDAKGRYSVFTSEAQKYLSKEAPMVIQNKLLGFAIIIDSLPNRILAKFYITFFKPSYPVKIFSNEKEAMNFINVLRCKEKELV